MCVGGRAWACARVCVCARVRVCVRVCECVRVFVFGREMMRVSARACVRARA